MFDALAFVILNVGTRSPARVMRDIAAAFRKPAAFARGLVRTGIGIGLLLLGSLVALPAIPASEQAFEIIEIGLLIAALLVEQLVGDDLRGRVRRTD